MEKTFFDLCPISSNKETITVNYKAYSGLGLEKTYYTKAHFSCSNPTCAYENCPLFNKAPSNF